MTVTEAFNATRDELITAIAGLPDPAKADLAASWPHGVPGLKGDHDHTFDERERIQRAIGDIHRKHGIQATVAHGPEAKDDLAGQAACSALKARLTALPVDLRDHVNTAGLDAGIAHLDHHHKVTTDHAQQLEQLLHDAEETASDRRRRIHGALSASELNEDDLRHGIIQQLTARVASSTQVTAVETDWIVDAVTRVELDQAALMFTDQGAPILVSLDTKVALPPCPVERDWAAWCKANKLTQKTLVARAGRLAEELGLPAPTKVADITHPALVLALDGDTPVPVPAPLVSADGGEVIVESLPTVASPPTLTVVPTLVTIHTPDGVQVITDPNAVAAAVTAIREAS